MRSHLLVAVGIAPDVGLADLTGDGGIGSLHEAEDVLRDGDALVEVIEEDRARRGDGIGDSALVVVDVLVRVLKLHRESLLNLHRIVMGRMGETNPLLLEYLIVLGWERHTFKGVFARQLDETSRGVRKVVVVNVASNLNGLRLLLDNHDKDP